MFEDIQNWLATHKELVDAAKWLFLIILGWVTGLFGWAYTKFRRARVKAIPEVSRCYQITYQDNTGKSIERSAFFIKIALENPSATLAILRRVTLTYKPIHPLKRFTKQFNCTSFPSPVKIKVGDIIKLIPVLFTSFPAEICPPSPDGRLGPKEYQEGYILVATETFGSYSPKHGTKGVKIKLRGYFTDGRTHSSTSHIHLVSGFELLEEQVSGITEYLKDENTRNLLFE
jgi:hypothetical protein